MQNRLYRAIGDLRGKSDDCQRGPFYCRPHFEHVRRDAGDNSREFSLAGGVDFEAQRNQKSLMVSAFIDPLSTRRSGLRYPLSCRVIIHQRDVEQIEAPILERLKAAHAGIHRA